MEANAPHPEDLSLDYETPAEVFWSVSAGRLYKKGSVRFRRFDRLSEAVRFVLADKTERRFYCAIDTVEQRFEADQIEALYKRDDFPHAAVDLPRA